MPKSETVVIADASPLVHLDRIGRLELLPALYGQVTIPATVAAEAARGCFDWPGMPITTFPWLTVVPDRIDPAVVMLPRLDPGEVAALSLAKAIADHRLILDDRAARAAAAHLGLHYIGTAGVIIAAWQQRLLPRVAPVLDELLASGFHLSAEVRLAVLRKTGEAQ